MGETAQPASLASLSDRQREQAMTGFAAPPPLKGMSALPAPLVMTASPYALRAAGISQRLQQIGAEELEVDHLGEGVELIAEVAQPLQTIIEIEETRLSIGA